MPHFRTLHVLGLVVASILALTYSSAAATVLRVAKDGTGDYSVLADAVDAAAAGDTISIGPGEYTDVRVFEAPGGLVELLAVVDVAELTILGDQCDAVTIGPVTPASNLENGPSGIVCTVGGNVRVSGVTLRNVSRGVWGNGDWVEVENSRFVGCYRGVEGFVVGGTTVRSSVFVSSEDRGVFCSVARGGTSALIEDCQFEDNLLGLDSQVPNTLVRNCVFRDDFIGAQFSFGSLAVVEHCDFASEDVDLVIAGAQVEVRDNVFGDTGNGNIAVRGRLVGSNNILMGGTIGTITISTRSSVSFFDNHILNSSGYSVRCKDGDPGLGVVTHDFRDNYWGTTDLAQIQEWIIDRHDSESIYQYAVFSPIHGVPVNAETSSFGQLKARFGAEALKRQ